MSAISIQVPYPVFYDRDGLPIDNGNIYIGVANLDPVTNPLQVYYDDALTITASQPLKTSNGYVYRNGTPAQLYVNANNFSIRVESSNNTLVYNFPDGTGLGPSASDVAFTGFKGQVGTVASLAAAGGADWIGSVSGRSAQESIDYTGVRIQANKIAPPGSLIVAPTGTGNLTGNYTYSVNYRTANGVSSPGPRVGPVTFAAQQASLTGIPVSADSTVIARDIYRTVANPSDTINLLYVGTINDNTTTTFTDNVADGSLGAAMLWAETTGGTITVNGTRVANVLGNSVSFGENTGTGYSSTAVGNFALTACTTGARNTAYGVYALTSVTTGNGNTAAGVHAGNNLTTGGGNCYYGYGAGWFNVSGNENAAFGYSAMQEAPGGTTSNAAFGAYALWLSLQTLGHNTAVGFRAGSENIAGSNNIFLGAYAGAKSTISDQFVVDSYFRADDNEVQNKSLIWGRMDATGNTSVQRLKINGRLTSSNTSTTQFPDATNAGWYLNENGVTIFSTGTSAAATSAQLFYNGGALVGQISVSGGTTTSFQNLSDKRAKTNIVSAPEAAPIVKSIPIRSFDWKANKKHVTHGVIAQELKLVTPDAVNEGDDDAPWFVDKTELIPLLVKALQEALDRIETLEKRSV